MTTSETGFDPTTHLTDLKGKAYLGARHRLQWLRSEHPLWTVNTGIVEMDFTAGYAVVFAEIIDETGRLIARSMKTETRSDFGDFVEKAETGAIGRSCAVAGYGTEDAVDLEEGTVSDTPVSSGRAPSPSARPSAAHLRAVVEDDPTRDAPAPWEGSTGRTDDGGTCPDHGQPWKFVKAGTSARTGKPYDAFWSCQERNCDKKPPKAWAARHEQ